jgi:YggT family protein
LHPRNRAIRVAAVSSLGALALMGLFFEPILRIVDYLLTLYWWVVVAAAVMSWLIAMRVVNTYSRPVSLIADFLYRATEPALRPIRRILPNFGGLDISPVILLLIIWLVQMELRNLIFYVYRM